MNRINTYLNSLGRATRAIILGLAVIFVSAGIAQAATTITTDITTANLTTTAALTVGTTLGVTGDTTLASTTVTSLKAGQTGTRLTRIAAGYCVITAAFANSAATSTATNTNCLLPSGVIALTAGERVLVQATSSLPVNLVLQSASTTALGINVNVLNVSTTTSVASATYALNYWVFAP